MKSNEKGITLVTLVITMIVLVILASVTIYTGSNIIKQAQLQTINTNIMLIQAKVKTISEQAKFNKNTSGYQGYVVTDVTGNEKIQKLVSDGVIDDASKYYVLWQEHLNDMGLEKVDVEDGYVVNYDTEVVIYVKGFEYDVTTYYKSTDLKTVAID